jgi:hypothetical protein
MVIKHSNTFLFCTLSYLFCCWAWKTFANFQIIHIWKLNRDTQPRTVGNYAYTYGTRVYGPASNSSFGQLKQHEMSFLEAFHDYTFSVRNLTCLLKYFKHQFCLAWVFFFGNHVGYVWIAHLFTISAQWVYTISLWKETNVGVKIFLNHRKGLLQSLLVVDTQRTSPSRKQRTLFLCLENGTL